MSEKKLLEQHVGSKAAQNKKTDALVTWAEEHPEARQLACDIKMLLPGGSEMPPHVRLALAWISLHHGLSPFLDEMWALEVPKGSGDWVLYPGVAAWRRSAADSGVYVGGKGRPCTMEEREALGARPEDVAWAYEAYVSGMGTMPIVGYGIVTAEEQEAGRTWKNGGPRPLHRWSRAAKVPWHVARTRAEKDALKQRFPLRWHAPGMRMVDTPPVHIEEQETLANNSLTNGDNGRGPERTAAEAAAELYDDWDDE